MLNSKVARQMPRKIEGSPLGCCHQQAVDRHDLVRVDPFIADNDSGRRSAASPDHFDGRCRAYPQRTMHRRSGPAGDHAITARPQPGSEGVLGQRGHDELRDVNVREDRTMVLPQAAASEPATRQRCTTDEHLVHAAMLAICADNSGASPEGCAQGCG